MDDDPALDYTLYEGMTKDENNKPVSIGCLGILLFFLIPCIAMIGFL